MTSAGFKHKLNTNIISSLERGVMMTRHSLASLILKRIERVEEDNNHYIILYRFDPPSPPIRFYTNLRELEACLNIERPFKGVILCRGRRSAEGVLELVKKYCPEYILGKIDIIKERIQEKAGVG